ncbi:hypothetical protein JHL18_03710 [Clostridium sp. YIM B02505]|uniref:Rod shape-determining protein MreD n=1 Tax=Clostridium yunnanense TaxID=2800325 RepID=A0ABS1EK65_9CLOT|nr:hypothetical protein [Clostridium yunnanense]MBK1809745.1 hypothetical protein [Clostridium yunnanense]
MLKLTLLEVILRGVPETLLFIWAIYVLTQTPIKYSRVILTSIIISLLTFVIRLLPINIGINTFLVIVVSIYLYNKINKIPIKQSISTTILIFIIEYICELINVIGLQLLKFDLNKLFQNPLNKILYATPSLVFFAIAILTIVKIKRTYFPPSPKENM